jgi:hypothetical protein
MIVGLGTAIFVSVLVHLVVLSRILRRAASKFGGQTRVEVVHVQAPALPARMMAPEPATAAAAPATVAGDGAPEGDDYPESETLEEFDIGPTYEEELRMKEEAMRQHEEAVMRQIFEDNLRLREELGV